MIKWAIAFLWIPAGTWIKWIAVFFLSIFDGVWLFFIWQSIRERGFATDDGWIDRDETPFKFWFGVAFTLTLGAIGNCTYRVFRDKALGPFIYTDAGRWTPDAAVSLRPRVIPAFLCSRPHLCATFHWCAKPEAEQDKAGVTR